MAFFSYQALDERGHDARGVVEAPSETAAVAALTGRGLYPTAMSTLGSDRPIAQKLGRARIRSGDITDLAQQLGSLIQSGFPIDRALTALVDQAETIPMALLLSDLKRRLQEGETVGAAVSAHPGAFDPLFRAMVRAGEAGSFLGEAFVRIGSLREREANLVRKVRGALTYPTVLAVVMLIVVGLMFTLVIPEMAQMFNGLSAALPAPTVFVLEISGFVQANLLPLIAAPILLALALWAQLSTAAGRRRVDALALSLPRVGGLVRKLAVARLARTLSTLLANGVTLVTALAIARDVPDNQVIAEAVDSVVHRIEKGERLSGPLRDTGVFPPMAVHMATLGEETGNLAPMLERVAERYEHELAAEIEGLVQIIEPVMTIVIGVVIGGVVLAMMMPIFEMGNAVQ